MKFTIEPEFKDLIPPLDDQEYEILEQSIIEDGCRDPLVIWAGENILLDGHNRYKICLENNLPYKTVSKEFDSEDDAKRWVLINQLGRRNLNPDALSILRGQLYNLRKSEQGGDRKSNGKNYQMKTTAQEIAKQTGVSEKTVRNDGKYAEAVEKIKEKIDSDFKKKVQDGEAPAKKDIIAAAEILPFNPQAAEKILSGEITPAKVASQMEALEDSMTVNSGLAVMKAFFMEAGCLAQKAFSTRWTKTLNDDGKAAVQKDFKKFISSMEKYQDLFIKNVKEI